MADCPFCGTTLPAEASTGGAAGLGVCTECFNPALLVWRDGSELAEPLRDSHDVRSMAPKKSITASLLEHAKTGMESLPVLPEISRRILTLLKDPNFGMNALSGLIRQDSVLSLAIMKQANSAAFGGLQEIVDLNGACARLGMKTVANTVQLVANRNLFITGNPLLKHHMERLWLHSVATAHCGGEIARLTLAPDRESVFLAGLVHDIGKVLLLELVSSARDRAVRDLPGNPDLLGEVIGSLHRLMGLLICQSWNLPPAFRAAVYFHHAPEQCPAKDWLALVHITTLANTIAQIEGYGSRETVREAFLASHPSTVYLGLSDIKLATLRIDLRDTLEALFEAAG